MSGTVDTGGAGMRSAGHLLVECLLAGRTDLAFCVPGESYLDMLDGLHEHRDRIRLVTCRQEGGAAFMAEAYGKLTGRPGVCLVTRGPGATNAAIGVHTAFQDSTPMILLVGQAARPMLEREAFQEVDYQRLFGGITKWTAQVNEAQRLPEFMARAYATATAGRAGPVVLALPEDMLTERVQGVPLAPVQGNVPEVGAAAFAAAMKRLAAAERPLLLAGGSGWTAPACDQLRRFAERNRLPVACTFRRQDRMDNASPSYVGDVGVAINPLLAERIHQADVVLVLGARLGEMTTSGYTLFVPPRPRQALIHVHPGSEEIGRVFQPEIGLNAGVASFCAALEARAEPLAPGRWDAWTRQARADYEAGLACPPQPGELQMPEVMAHLHEVLPPDAVVTNGAGNYTVWAHRWYRFRHFPSQLAPTNGAMGYGVPAAVAAQLVFPARRVVCFAGDGCFLMNGQELATAVRYRLPIVFLVVNNGMFGTIRMHQEREYPGRTVGTQLTNPDFALYAQAFGAAGETVRRTADFAPALARALAHDGPSLIELQIDPQAITPRQTLDQLREKSLQRQAEGQGA